MIFEQMMQKEYKDAFINSRKIKLNYDEEFYKLTEEYVYSEKFDNDIKRLINKDYYFDLPRKVLIKKSLSNRRRTVFVFEDHEKIILQFLNYLLVRHYEYAFSDNLYSARTKSRTLELFRTLKKLDPERKYYVVKSDIHKYSESIDVEILEKQMREICSDEPEFIDFITWLISRNKFYFNGEVVEGYTSVMGGNPTSAFFYNLNLIHVDEVMSKRCLLYSRYADDICVVCDSKESAEENMALLTKMVRDLNLEFNEEKSGIVSPGEPLDLLGFQFGNGYTDLADNTFSKVVNKFKHRANSLNRRVRKGKLTRPRATEIMARLITGYLYGYENEDEDTVYRWTDRVFSVITTPERLAIIDKVAEDCIRFVGTGRKTNAKYRITYSDIKEMGFKPLVYSFYHQSDEKKTLE